jgi:hypothetical protein
MVHFGLASRKVLRYGLGAIGGDDGGRASA